MKVLYFDTETTGLPKTRDSAVKGPNNWPHLVSIAWIVDDGISKKEHYFVVKPQWIIPADSVSIHGITQEYAEKNGVDLREIIPRFLDEKPDVIVAHNMNYDFNVLVNAIIWDLKLSLPQFPKLVCTMELGKGICRIPVSYSKSKYKSPKLVELYEFIFKVKPDQLHNSLEDTRMLVKVVEGNQMLRSIIGLPMKNYVPLEDARPTKRLKTLDL